MSRIGTRIAAITAGAAGLFAAFIALSPAASAEPAPAPAPAVPGLDIIQNLASPAGITQALQNAASVLSTMPSTLTGGSPAVPAAPAVAPPTASINLPQPSAATGLVPSGQVNVPQAPGLPVQLPSQLSFPGDLTTLVPGIAAPAPNAPGLPPAAVPAAPAAPAAPAGAAQLPAGLALLNPIAALP